MKPVSGGKAVFGLDALGAMEPVAAADAVVGKSLATTEPASRAALNTWLILSPVTLVPVNAGPLSNLGIGATAGAAAEAVAAPATATGLPLGGSR
jgi:hypothetical protein